MNIKILGTGCSKCNKLEKTVKSVISKLQIDIDVEKVQDMKAIMDYPILSTPGLVINEKVVSFGKVPGEAEIEKFIMNAKAEES